MCTPCGQPLAPAVLLSCLVLGGTAVAAEPDPLLMEGFELAYNLDHEAAIDTFTRAIEAGPNEQERFDRLELTVDDRDHHGPGLVLDHHEPGVARLLVWTE